MNEFVHSVTLKAGSWQATVLPGFGMNMICLRCDGKAILREPSKEQTLQQDPHVYGIPLLFPANRTAGGRFSFEGKSYQLPVNEPGLGNNLHGDLYNAPFEVIQQNEASLAAVYENHGERYPFPFRMEITDMLSEQGLTRHLRLENIGETAMPFTLAFHTAFREPKQFSVPIGRCAKRDERFLPTGKWEKLSKAEDEYRSGTSSNGRAISGFFEADGHAVKLDEIRFAVSENFDQWILFNGGGKQGFLCIEPQCGQVNGLNIPGGHRVLEPGESETFTIYIGKNE